MHTSATATSRRVVLGALLLSFAVTATTVSAQERTTAPIPLPLDTRVEGRLNESGGVYDGRYYVDYSFRIEEGDELSVLLDSSTPVQVIALNQNASGSFTMPGLDIPYASFTALQFPYRVAERTGEARLRVMARTPGATGRFTICALVTPTDVNPDDCITPASVPVPEPESSVEGFEIAAFALAQRLDTEGIDHADQSSGWGVRAGIGLSERLQVFGLYSSELADQGVPEGESAPVYDLTSMDVGARLYLTGNSSTLRPYITGTYGWREREEAYDSDYMYYGRSWGGGLGSHLFMGRSLAFDLGLSYNNASYTEIAFEEGDRVTLDDPFKATSLRIDIGLSLFLNY